MKKQLLLFVSTVLLGYQATAQTTDTVSTGAGYANQKWYSLQNDEQGTAQAKDNWDIAFEISGQAASIIGNTQKANFIIYQSPYSVTQWNLVDTAGINSWPKLYNADTSWSIGAFNKGINPSGQYDLGWGIYDMNTHFVNGDSCYVIKLSAGSYKKIKFDNLSNGVYNFTYSDINGANSQTTAIAKSSYTGKNFAYYDLTNNTALDREPATSGWDLTFVKYTAFIPTPYGVTGIVGNKGVKIAQVNNIPNAATYANYSAHSFKTEINEIGYDWKTYDFTTNSYIITDSLVYFVSDKAGNMWSFIPTGFGGSATGDFIFNKSLLSSTGIEDEKGNPLSEFTVYPNPVTDNNISVIFSSVKNIENVSFQISDITGKSVVADKISLSIGFTKYNTSINDLKGGVYFIQINANGVNSTQKFIKL